jgi:hypothetical protein
MKLRYNSPGIIAFFFLLYSNILSAQLSLKYEQNIAPPYDEVISMYRQLESKYPNSKLIEEGKTDIGKNLHLFIISSSKTFVPSALHEKGKIVLLINNGIHPGESDGVDASLKLAYDMLSNPSAYKNFLDKCNIAIIPVYNIDGYLNRSPYHRANQNGPVEQGFRANARNIDLNRDMIKTDTENARSLTAIFHSLNPDVFIDTHVSDGADYQYVMTLIPSLHSKLHPVMQEFLNKTMLPFLYSSMKEAGTEMIPYVESRGDNPETGIEAFMDHPRYVSGYATAFCTYAFVTESHMLKPYRDRVLATYRFFISILDFIDLHAGKIAETRREALEANKTKLNYSLQWELDTNRYDPLIFKGYTSRYNISKVTGFRRLYYDESQPWQKQIRFYNYYKPILQVQKPYAFIIPQAWTEVIERLKLNDVQMAVLSMDTIIKVESYYISSFNTSSAPYNGRYLHSQVQLHSENQEIQFYKGDYLINMNQEENEYIMQVLDPRAPDSFFAWGFFDAVLSRKEYFSDYVFESTAEKLLQDDQLLKQLFDKKLREDSLFRSNDYAQLNFIYEHSPWAEPSYNRYPVFRINK